MIPMPLPAPEPDALEHSQRLAALIAREIGEQGGRIPFSRFMELALYAPGLGYYSAGATKFGAAGDFVTAPELGPLFSLCVANACTPLLQELGAAADWLELGGGSGALASVVLPRLAELDALPARYLILEPSADLRQRQQERLKARLMPELFERVRWLDGPPEQPWEGVLFANEVLDALPTTRWIIRGSEVVEEQVGLDADGAFCRMEAPADEMLVNAVRYLESQRGSAFADGYHSELLVQLPWWIRAVAGPLQRGLMLFFDYGYSRHEFYLPDRREGTLVCHYRHRAHHDPFVLPGLTDISAFVDFTAVAEAGQQAGFDLAGYCSQASFLLGNGLEQELAKPAIDERAMRARNEQARKLVLPGEMGERFKAIGLQRGIDAERLFALGDLSARL